VTVPTASTPSIVMAFLTTSVDTLHSLIRGPSSDRSLESPSQVRALGSAHHPRALAGSAVWPLAQQDPVLSPAKVQKGEDSSAGGLATLVPRTSCSRPR
jgi:hypothetical protein